MFEEGLSAKSLFGDGRKWSLGGLPGDARIAGSVCSHEESGTGPDPDGGPHHQGRGGEVSTLGVSSPEPPNRDLRSVKRRPAGECGFSTASSEARAGPFAQRW